MAPQRPDLEGLRKLAGPQGLETPIRHTAKATSSSSPSSYIELAFGEDGSLREFVTGAAAVGAGAESAGTEETVVGAAVRQPAVVKERWTSGANASLMALTYVTYNTMETWDGKQNLTCEEEGCANPEDRVWVPSLVNVWHNCSSGLRHHSPNTASGGGAREGGATEATVAGTVVGTVAGTVADDGTTCRVVSHSQFDPSLHAKYGAPLDVFVEYVLRPEDASVTASLLWFNKTTTRLPESLMLGFRPNLVNGSASFRATEGGGASLRSAAAKEGEAGEKDAGTAEKAAGAAATGEQENDHEQHAQQGDHNRAFSWALDVLGQFVLPTEVGTGCTNQYQRGVWSGMRYSADGGNDPHRGLMIETLDAGLACPILPGSGMLGDSSPMGEGVADARALRDEDIAGISMSLVQNLMPISGFAQWYPFGTGDTYQKQDEASRFRFVMRRLG